MESLYAKANSDAEILSTNAVSKLFSLLLKDPTLETMHDVGRFLRVRFKGSGGDRSLGTIPVTLDEFKRASSLRESPLAVIPTSP